MALKPSDMTTIQSSAAIMTVTTATDLDRLFMYASKRRTERMA